MRPIGKRESAITAAAVRLSAKTTEELAQMWGAKNPANTSKVEGGRMIDNLDSVLLALWYCVEQAGSLRALARRWKLSAAYLSDVKNGRRAPGPSILKHLGYTSTHQWVTTYTKVKR